MFAGKDNQSQSNSQGEVSQVNGLQTEELTQLRDEVEELRKQNTLLQAQLDDKDSLIDTLVSNLDMYLGKILSVCIHHWGGEAR